MGVSNHSHCDHGMAECGRLAKQKADTAIITINPSGTIQSVDKNCCDMFGYRMEELLGQPVSIFIPPPYREQHDTYLHNYHETGKAKIIGRSRNVEGQHKDGTIFTIRLSVSEIKIPGSTIYVGMIDKLENKTATITADTGGTITNCENTKRIWGYEPEELIGQNLSLLMPSPYSESHNQYLKNHHETGICKVIGRVRNVPALHQDGTIFPVCLQVQRIQMDGTVFFRGKIDRVDTANEMVFTLDQVGMILSCNHNFAVPLLGTSASNLRGIHISSVLPVLRYRSWENNESFLGTKRPHSDDTLSTNAAKVPRMSSCPSSTVSDALRVSSLSDLQQEIPEATLESLMDSVDLESWIGVSETLCRHADRSFFRVKMTVAKFNNNDRTCFAIKLRRLIDAERYVSSSPSHGDTTQNTIGDGKYVYNKVIGSGCFGRVYLGRNVSTNQEVAVKCLFKKNMSPEDITRATREITILKKLRHPHVCNLFDWYNTEDFIYLVMEYASGGELFDHMKSRGKLSENEARHFFKQILSAVDFCHSNNIIHRDLKDKNILLDFQSNIKLIDFGLSNFSDGVLRDRTYCGTPAYSAPEMILGSKYRGPEVDVWSLGVLLYNMVSGRMPFRTINDISQGTFAPLRDVSLGKSLFTFRARVFATYLFMFCFFRLSQYYLDHARSGHYPTSYDEGNS